MPSYWIMKSEPDAFSIDDLKQLHRSPWDGVRNYQARNFMKTMKKDDLIFFYHSSCKLTGIVGVAKVCKEAYPDHTSWDRNSKYFDKNSTPETPKWYMVDVEFIEKWPKTLALSVLKASPELQNMQLIKKGNRLSIMPITQKEWEYISIVLKK